MGPTGTGGDILGEPGRRARSPGSSSAPDLGRFRLDWLCLAEPPAPPGASPAQPCRVGERTGVLVSRPQPFLIREETALCVCVRASTPNSSNFTSLENTSEEQASFSAQKQVGGR